MPRATLQALRYARSWGSGGIPVREEELLIDRGEDRVPATLFLPPGVAGARGRGLPGWVVLHGITRPGRAHPSLLRFARSLAHTGAAVLVPEIPEWRELRLAPTQALPTIRAAILALDARPETLPGALGLIGFSFGAPQALIAAGDPEVRDRLAVAVGFGGYARLEPTLDFHFTGEFERGGVPHRLRPDPYGRWIVGANYLTATQAHADAGDVAEALRTLAVAAGEAQRECWDPVFAPLKSRLRQGIGASRRELFDLFAAPDSREPEASAAREVVRALCTATDRVDPLLNPIPALRPLSVPVHLVHGRQDQLIPFTETLALADVLPAPHVVTTVTDLFTHSQGSRAGSALHGAREGIRFLGALRGILGAVRGPRR